MSVLDGKWFNYCDLQEVVNCVIPRTKVTDCHHNCDDPNKDGVVENMTLCQRVEALEKSGGGGGGAQGPKGVTGPQGPIGHNGKDGTGVTMKGSDTILNIKNKAGAAGDMWLISDVGIQHGHGLVSDGKGHWQDVGAIQGPQGIPGVVGPHGPAGVAGTNGVTGPRGLKGDKGDQGAVGPKGSQGIQGVKGIDAVLPADLVTSTTVGTTEKRIAEIVQMTQANYTALATKQADKLYIIVG